MEVMAGVKSAAGDSRSSASRPSPMRPSAFRVRRNTKTRPARWISDHDTESCHGNLWTIHLTRSGCASVFSLPTFVLSPSQFAIKWC